MTQRRIVHFIDSLAQGGSERQALQLATLQKLLETDVVDLATLHKQGALKERAIGAGFTDILEFPLNSFYDLTFVRNLLRCADHLRQKKVNVVQTHDFYSNIFGLISSFLGGVPVRIAAKRESINLRTRNQRLVELACFRLAHCIVVNSEAIQRELISAGIDRQKIQVIPNGLDSEFLGSFYATDGKIRSNILEDFGIKKTENNCLVTMVANFRLRVKDHVTFLKSARRVLDQNPQVKFLLVGEGPLMEEMVRLAESLGIGESIIFLGECETVQEVLSISDVCVLSSRSEGLSNAILEYMAASRPVVITDVGAARELVEDGVSGYIVPPGDDAAMSERIIRLLEDRDLARRFGDRGRKHVEVNFSDRSRFSKTMKLYDALLSSIR